MDVFSAMRDISSIEGIVTGVLTAWKIATAQIRLI